MEIDRIANPMGRRNFIKATALATAAATFPATGLMGQDARSAQRPAPTGRKRNLLFVNDSPAKQERLIGSIKSIPEFEFTVTPVKVDPLKPEEIARALQGVDADVVLLMLPRLLVNTRLAIVDANLKAPLIMLPGHFDLIMLEADVCSAIRAKGEHAMLANSEAEAIELVRLAAAPRVLEGKKALVFGRPFDSSSVPARNLNADYVYQRTGVRLEYRPLEELRRLLDQVSDAGAAAEMERWKKEAAKVEGVSDRALLDCSRMCVLLRSIVEKEGLSCISIDCLNFSFDSNAILPLPCLAFTRLRDEGFASPCEADLCGTLTSMFLQEISGKASYFANVSAVHEERSTVVLRHCVAPTKLLGPKQPPLRYILRDYHGLPKPGVTPQVDFPVGLEVTMGQFSKDLRSFVLWPGTTVEGKDPSRSYYCSNRLEVQVADVGGFRRNVAGCHSVVVAGSYREPIRDALLRMSVDLIGPAEPAPGALPSQRKS